jgi:dTMP kinase
MGTLIALEGIDGSGKSTQARRLRERLEAGGRPAVLFREPGDTEFGDRLREIFRHGRDVTPEEEMRLFIEDRRIDVARNILPALAEGKIVVMDRYYFSTMAYQGALGIDPEEIRAINEAFAPRPDLTLILDLPAERGAERIRASRGAQDSFEGVEYLARVRALFLTFVAEDVEVIDADVDSEEVAASIVRRVETLLRGSEG